MVFLHAHNKGYTLNPLEAKQSFFTGMPYALRHVELAKKGGSLGHLVIASIEAMPILGAIAALIERVIASYFPSKADAPLPSIKADAPLPSIKADAPLPSIKADAPLPSTKADAPLPSIKADAPLPSTKADAPLPSIMADAPLPSITKVDYTDAIEILPLPEGLIADNQYSLSRHASLPEPMPSFGKEYLIKNLIAFGRYTQEAGDTTCGNEYVGENQGSKMTRRIFLEMIHAGIDLFSDEVLEEIKKFNKTLYKIILTKAYGHIHSKKGFRSGVNFEGSCEALSLLMLLHSINVCKKSYELQLDSDEDRSFWEDKVKLFNHIESVFRRAITAESTENEVKEAFRRIKAKESQLICSGNPWHSEVFLYSHIDRADRMIYHNRGLARRHEEEIELFNLSPGGTSEDILRKASDRFRLPEIEQYPSEAVKLLTKDSVKRGSFSLKASKGGHCTHASVKAAILSIISSWRNSLRIRGQENIRVYKQFTKAHRNNFKALFKRVGFAV